jgi:cation diffusion facilitator CzcD-associated flavoprotein CzcO
LPYSQHPNRHFLSKVPQKIGIIGGGISGLITAKVLKQQGYDVQILEKRSHIGGVWYNNYEGAGLQGPYYTYNMPDFTFPDTTPMLPKQEVILQYLERYVEEFGLRGSIRLDSEVEKIRQLGDDTWELDLKDGSIRAFDFLVVCNGAYHKPFVPSFPGAASFQGQILHSSQFKQAQQLCAGKQVVVIGGGKSALDIQDVASDYAATPVIGLMRTIHWTIPLSFTLLGLNPGITMFSRFVSLFHSADYAESGWINWFLHPIGQLYWRFIEKRIVQDLPPSARPNVPLSSEYPHFDTRTKSYTSKLQNQQVLIKRGYIDHFTPNGLVTTEGEVIHADTVVMATGYDRDFLGTEEENGEQWRYRGMILPKVRNFAVIGHISTIRTALVINLQAAWLSEVLRGQVILPSDEDMKADSVRRKNYKRKGVEKSRKSLHFRIDFLADQLLGDMKLQTRRAKTWFQHYFGRVSATDYRSVVTHRV